MQDLRQDEKRLKTQNLEYILEGERNIGKRIVLSDGGKNRGFTSPRFESHSSKEIGLLRQATIADQGGVLVILSGGENTALEDGGFGGFVMEKLMGGWDVEIFRWNTERDLPSWLSLSFVGSNQKLTLKDLSDPTILPILFSCADPHLMSKHT